MTQTTRREWTEIAGLKMAEVEGLALYVSDEQIGHMTPLAAESDRAAALADYGHAYDAGEIAANCKVRWVLWRDGEKIDSGIYRFTSGATVRVHADSDR